MKNAVDALALRATRVLAFLVYLPIQIALLPLLIVGALIFSYYQIVVSRRVGVSQTGMEVQGGAGYDTRAFGPMRQEELRFFEVDLPVTQALKIASLDQAGLSRDHVTFVTTDFESDNLFERLAAAGYDPQQPTVFLWEGVTLYLAESDVRRTLADIRAHAGAGSVIACDFYSDRMVQLGKKGPAKELLKATDEALGFSLPFAENWESVLDSFWSRKAGIARRAIFSGVIVPKGPLWWWPSCTQHLPDLRQAIPEPDFPIAGLHQAGLSPSPGHAVPDMARACVPWDSSAGSSGPVSASQGVESGKCACGLWRAGRQAPPEQGFSLEPSAGVEPVGHARIFCGDHQPPVAVGFAGGRAVVGAGSRIAIVVGFAPRVHQGQSPIDERASRRVNDDLESFAGVQLPPATHIGHLGVAVTFDLVVLFLDMLGPGPATDLVEIRGGARIHADTNLGDERHEVRRGLHLVQKSVEFQSGCR